MNLREHFPDAKVIEYNALIEAEEVGTGPWIIYVYGRDGYHSGGAWFGLKMKYPDEEISFEYARQRYDSAMSSKCEVRICDGMDHLVLHSIGGKILIGTTFWNEANPDPAAIAVANKLIGKGKK